jgi:hypothetical protein
VKPETKLVAVLGNHERLVMCSCGMSTLLPVNALSLLCRNCGNQLVAANSSSFGVMQR